MAGDAGRVGQRDRVVAAEDQRNGTGRGDGVHGLLEVAQRPLDLPRRHLDVAGVDHGDVLERVDPQGQVRAGAVVAEVVGLPDRLRSEAGAGPVAGAAVERCAHDHDVRTAERLGVVEVDPVDAEEGDVGAELGAVPSHDAGVSSRWPHGLP